MPLELLPDELVEDELLEDVPDDLALLPADLDDEDTLLELDLVGVENDLLPEDRTGLENDLLPEDFEIETGFPFDLEGEV